MFPSSQIVLVTGANRGIGLSIVQATALRNPAGIYIPACRSHASGVEAIIQLKELSVTAQLDVVELDITDDESVVKAAEYVKRRYGRLDVLVNNAGIALLLRSNSSLPETRENFSTTFNANTTSIYTTTTIFLSLLHASSEPKVVNISSGRASITRSANGDLPPSRVLSYGVSKIALNALTVEMQRAEDATPADAKVQYWVANPGHCKTAFNGFRGTKDPLEGAEVVVQLVTGERGRWKKGAFWEFEEGVMREVPW